MRQQEDDLSMTECRAERLEFHAPGKRAVVGKFDGGMIWIDLDATDDLLHGRQEGRFFHGHYGHWMLPRIAQGAFHARRDGGLLQRPQSSNKRGTDFGRRHPGLIRSSGP
jgi:hypothetical protein